MLLPCLTGLALAGVLAVPAGAQTVDEVVARNIRARGGLEKLRAGQSVRMSGTITQGADVFPFTLESKRPRRRRIEFSVKGLTGVQAFDGETAWALMPFGGDTDPHELPEEMAKDAEEEADLDGPLVDYQAKGHQLELEATQELDGARVYKLKLTLKGGGVRHVYIDAETGLERKIEARRMLRGREVLFETKLSNYEEVEGLALPHSIEQGEAGSDERQSITIESVEINVPIDDARFEMPAKPRTRP